jgi:hypothetical protein
VKGRAVDNPVGGDVRPPGCPRLSEAKGLVLEEHRPQIHRSRRASITPPIRLSGGMKGERVQDDLGELWGNSGGMNSPEGPF